MIYMMGNCGRQVQLQVRLPACRSQLLVLSPSEDDHCRTSTDEFDSLRFTRCKL